MRELLFFIASSFWAGAAHAATPGHGKTIAAAYIVGARGKPIDALILGIFVTLSHTSGIVLVGVLASLGSTWLRPQRIEAYLAVAVGIAVIVLGLWMLWAQRDLVALAMGEAGEPGDGTDHKRGGEAAGPGFGGDDGGPAFGVGVEGCGGSAEGDADRAAKQSEEDGFGEELGTDVAFGSAQGAAQSDLGAAFED